MPVGLGVVGFNQRKPLLAPVWAKGQQTFFQPRADGGSLQRPHPPPHRSYRRNIRRRGYPGHRIRGSGEFGQADLDDPG